MKKTPKVIRNDFFVLLPHRVRQAEQVARSVAEVINAELTRVTFHKEPVRSNNVVLMSIKEQETSEGLNLFNFRFEA